MSATAKIFMHGRSQAVRLPKEFRMAGKEVLVSREGKRVVLTPVEDAPFDVKAWWADLHQDGDAFIPPLPDDPPVEPEDFGFD
jgi:antitoxin VapB